MGAIGYYSGLTVYETYGLVTPEVIDAAPPRERSSPGHDVRVEIEFFLDRKPTYTMSFVKPIEEEMPAGWEQHPLARLIEVERHPLPTGKGFPEGHDLRLLRFLRWE